VACGEGGAGWEITETRRGPASLAKVVEEHAMHIFSIHTILLPAYEYKEIFYVCNMLLTQVGLPFTS
jgi:hypothetical protein